MEKRAFTLEELAVETDCQLIGNPKYMISGVSELEHAAPHDAVYVAEPRFLSKLDSTQAGVIFIAPKFVRPADRNYLLSDDPALAFQKFSKIIHAMRQKPPGFQGVHPSAVIHPSAHIGAGVHIGPNAVIERDVTVHDNANIGALVYLGPEVTIDEHACIHPNVTIHEGCRIGKRSIILSGAVIGSLGFGFRPDEQGHHQRYEHMGNVIIEDDVEVGANTTIDRARLRSTRIGHGTKIDNQVQIAHNCEIGSNNIIVSQVGIAGSCKTGAYVVLAGRVCINDHVSICAKTVIAACTAVLRDITAPGTYIGFPAIPLKRHHRLLVCFHNLDKIFADVQKMKRLLKLNEKEQKAEAVPGEG